jgi:xanthine/CO dehydrogenase XdhC/CoxF family maturation factor
VSARRIIEAFETWRDAGRQLVLATVVETAGSTYTKAGHRILINDDGQFHGLVSGGCLEGDLAEHSMDVIATQRPKLLTYDLRGEADEMFGLGIGCNGMFRVLLQPQTPQSGYQPFASIARCMLDTGVAAVATIVESADPQTPAGATLVQAGGDAESFDMPADLARALRDGCADVLRAPVASIRTQQRSGFTLRVLYSPLWPLPRLLILGAGLDAVPLVAMADQVGWRVTVADRRRASLYRGDLARAEHVHEIVPAELAERLTLSQFDAAIVMTHHLDTDRTYLRTLADSPIPYIGLLGPPGRRDRLLADLGAVAEKLRSRLHAPVGIAIGADSPETIALAILAELQATLRGRRSVACDTT